MSTLRNIKGLLFEPVWDIPEGRHFDFIAGDTIAVEKYAFLEGQSDFDWHVYSRETRNGDPVAVAAMRESLESEFNPHRIASRLPLPIAFGRNEGSAWSLSSYEMDVTYGEISPQVFVSEKPGASAGKPIAWRVDFRRVYYNGTVGSKGALTRAKQGVARPGPSASTRIAAADSAAAQRSSELRALASDFFLRVWVDTFSSTLYRRLEQPFGLGDVVGEPPTVWQRLERLFD